MCKLKNSTLDSVVTKNAPIRLVYLTICNPEYESQKWEVNHWKQVLQPVFASSSQHLLGWFCCS